MFDCCGSGPSAKDIQHTNRSGNVFPDITFTSDEKCVKSQDNFLDNQNNKARFIFGLSNHLSQNRFQSVADADTTMSKLFWSITHEERIMLSMLMILMFYVY